MKISEWKLKFSETVSDKLKRISKLSDDAKMRMSNLQDRMSAAGSKIGKDTSSLINSIKDRTGSAIESITGMGGGLTSVLTNPYVLALAACVAFSAKATSMAMNFETGMAKINATALLPKERLDGLRNQIIDIGRNSGVELEKLPQSFEMILSQTNDVKLSMDVLKASVKGADAGFADLDTVAGSIAQTMNLVKKEGIGAQQVLDTFMTAKRVGAGEFKDFATYMPQLIAAGNNLGVTFNNTAGTFAYMTSMGQSAADSAMLMQNIYGILGRGDVQKNMKKIGVNIFDKKGAMRDMDVIFGELAGKMAGLSDKGKSNLLENLGIKDMQAKSGFAVMIADANKLKTTMAEVKNGAGESDRAMAATANPMRTMAEIGNQFKGFMLDIGYAILPVVSSALSWIAEGVKAVISRVKDWWSHATLLQDIFWLIGKVLGYVWDAVKKVGDVLLWVYDHTVKPIWDAINFIYNKIKAILGFGKETIEVKAEVSTDGTVTAESAAPGKGAMTDAMVASMGGKANKALDGVSGGGSQVRNVIVNMNNQFTIRGANIKESMAEIKKIALETMVQVVQGAELTVAN